MKSMTYFLLNRTFIYIPATIRFNSSFHKIKKKLCIKFVLMVHIASSFVAIFEPTSFEHFTIKISATLTLNKKQKFLHLISKLKISILLMIWLYSILHDKVSKQYIVTTKKDKQYICTNKLVWLLYKIIQRVWYQII